MQQKQSEYEVRKGRLAHLRTRQGEAYPVDCARTESVAEFLGNFAHAREDQKPSVLSGRVMAFRRMGGLSFLRVRDASGEVQVVVRVDDLGDVYEAFLEVLDVGDIVEVTGKSYVTKTGEQSLLATHARMLAKALRPLPEKWHGLQDVEIRYRQRELDLIANPEVAVRFVLRSRMTSAFRRFLDDRGFIEVETPMLQTIPGGASARPFITHHNALGTDLYLRIAPELYLKRLLVGGFEKIYEMGRCFRNEGIDYAHNPEFTMMEMYWAYVQSEEYVAFLEEMLRYVLQTTLGEVQKVILDGQEVDFAQSWKKVSFYDAIEEACGINARNLKTPQDVIGAAKEKGISADFSGCHGMGEYLDELYKATARPGLVAPTWVYDYPLELKPLARKHTSDPALSASVQLVVCGAEIVNAYYHELNDPEDQRARFEAQQELRDKGSEEAQWMDEDFIASLEVGMPPAAGMGIGIDRFAAMLAQTPNLKEIILFPTLKPKRSQEASHGEVPLDIPRAILEKLHKTGVVYRSAEHGPMPEDSDAALGYAPELRPHHAGAKAMIVRGKKTKKFYHFTLPDDCKLDQKKVEEVIGEKWEFATPDDVLVVTRCVPGSVPPFGSLFGLQTHMDHRLQENKEIFFNAGSLTYSIALAPDDFISAESPIRVDVAKE